MRKNYHPKITTEGRTITDEFHQSLYTEKFEAIQKNEKSIAKKNRNNKWQGKKSKTTRSNQ